MEFKTNNVNETELVYSLLRERYPTQQIEIEYNDNTKEYLLTLTNKPYEKDPEVDVELNIKVIYGDSCTGDTPLLLMKDNKVYIETIQSIFDENKKVEYPGFKMFDKTIRLEKEYSLTDYQIWTDLGWTNINKVIRHKCDKKIYKVLTHTGYVKVTEDHSLITENKEQIKPKECTLDTKLLTSYPSEFNDTCDTISKDRAFIYGFFYGDGSCDKYKCPSGLKYSWALNNADMNVLNNLKNLLQKEYPDSKPVIYDTLESSGVYKLSMNNPKNMVEEFRHKFYDSDRYKKIPTEILNSNNEIIQSFFDGYWEADGCRKDKENIGCTRFDNKGQIGSAGLYYLMKKLGYNVSLNTRNDKEKMLRITVTKKKQRRISNKIKKIESFEHNDYVYDIETDIGRYQAGVGDLQIFNTDSVFLRFKFNREDFNLNRQDTFKLATVCGNNITNVFARPPIDLEFEKVFQPFILLTKKRYIGKKYEDTRDPFKLKTITNSGTAVTRRDFSKVVKDCYKEIIDCMVNQGNSDSAQEGVEIYKRYIDQLDAYQIDIDDLITSKTLAKSYSCALCKKKSEWIHLKCEEKDKKGKICGAESPLGSINCIKCKKSFNCIHKFNLVHVQLAIKMLKRKDEANINDRIPFIFIESDDRTLAKNDLGEDPVYVKKHNLKYNRSFYLESLGKTILAFLKICLNDYPSLLDEAIDYTNDKFDSYGSKKLKPSDFKLDNEGVSPPNDE